MSKCKAVLDSKKIKELKVKSKVKKNKSNKKKQTFDLVSR